MKFSVKILSTLVLGALLTLSAYAQVGEGIITGKVIGRDGMPAANMPIRIDRLNSLNANQHVIAQSFDAKTGKQGGYSFSGLPPGSYQVSVVEMGRVAMTLGDTPGTVITVADGRESTASFDLTKAPALGTNGTGATVAPAPSAKDLASDRAALEAADKNKKDRDKAFTAGTAAYKAGAAAEAAAKDETGRAAAAASYEEAAKQFQIVVVADPKQDVAFANLGNSFNKLKKYDDAAAAYQKAIELKPKEAAYYNNLGLALGGAKKTDEAKAAFDTAATTDPMKAGDYLFNEGAMYNNNQDYPKAIEAFKRCVVADPNNKGCLFQEAISYFSSADTMAQAEPLLTKFLTLNPSPVDKETAQGLLDAIHTTAPTEYKSQKALDDEAKAKATADKAAQKAPAKAPAATTKPK